MFAHIYGFKIQNKETTIKKYYFKSFARLYPLHFLTLLSSLFLIILLNLSTDFNFFIYSHNDLKHFILNLFFMSHWGFKDGHSFNAPVWSVSSEVILYAVFFALIIIFRFFKSNLLIYTLIILLFFNLEYLQIQPENPSVLLIKKSLLMFFIGSFLYEIIYKKKLLSFLITLLILWFSTFIVIFLIWKYL